MYSTIYVSCWAQTLFFFCGSCLSLVVYLYVFRKEMIHIFMLLFTYLSGRGHRPCVIRSRRCWMIQRPRLTDMSWHLMCVAVGQSPPGPFPGVNSQLECQKQYTSLSSLFFLCISHLQSSDKEQKEKRFGTQCGSKASKWMLKSQN